jgi:hypothetical protein
MPYRHPVAVTISVLWWGIYFGCFGASIGALLGLWAEQTPAPPSQRSDGAGKPPSGTDSATRAAGYRRTLIGDDSSDLATSPWGEAAHQCGGTLSDFSNVAGDQAGDLEELPASARLDKALPILEQFETTAQEAIQRMDEVSIGNLQHQTGATADSDRPADH